MRFSSNMISIEKQNNTETVVYNHTATDRIIKYLGSPISESTYNINKPEEKPEDAKADIKTNTKVYSGINYLLRDRKKFSFKTLLKSK